MENMDIMHIDTGTMLAVFTGIGLSAACGFRVFAPLLVLNLAATLGYIGLAPGFEWIGGRYATVAFSTATLLEIITYYIPWLDNVMDAVASPVSIIAGVLATASIITDMPPSMKWMISIIAGGGIAGLLQGASVALRSKSSLLTGGMGNFIVATLELVGAVITSLLAVILPVVAFIIAAAFAVHYLVRATRTYLRKLNGGR